jgi:small-conductance mechanosensitive channel
VALAVLLTGVLLAFAVSRLHRAVSARLVDLAEATVTKSGIADVNLLRASRLIEIQRRLTSYAAVVLYLVIAYSVIAIILRRFPFTRPWGESMRGFLFETGINVGLGIAHAIPGLVTIAIIVFLTRFVVRLIALWFHAFEQGSITGPRWLHPETSQPTRRLLTAAAWLFAIVLIFPYVPGSQTDAFKGISVLVGLIVTLGSSGLMNQVMSSFMITYSRALRIGDFVRIGEVEGTVMQLGMLSTKVNTVFGEEVTIPNAVVIAQTTTDFSRMVGEGVLTRTSVTIGYDTPWRQVHSLLLTAATRTPGIRKDVKPSVFQASLQDFYVEYTLAFGLERQDQRVNILAALHANIQDLFNEYGVQIMSPHYLGDPASPKVVPADKWFAAPAHAKEVSTR